MAKIPQTLNEKNENTKEKKIEIDLLLTEAVENPSTWHSASDS